MPECKVRRCARIDTHGSSAEIACASICRGDGRNRGNPLRLPYGFEVPKEECMVTYDRAADGAAKLVALEWRDRLRGVIEIVLGVERAIAKELVSTSVNLIRPRPRNRVDDSSRGFAVVCGVVGGEHREFLDRVHAQVSSQNASGGAIRVVVETNPIQPVIVLLRPRTGNGELLPKAAITAIGPCRKVWLSVDCIHARLKFGQVAPTAAIERQLADNGCVHYCTDVRTRKLYRGNFALHNHLLGD